MKEMSINKGLTKTPEVMEEHRWRACYGVKDIGLQWSKLQFNKIILRMRTQTILVHFVHECSQTEVAENTNLLEFHFLHRVGLKVFSLVLPLCYTDFIKCCLRPQNKLYPSTVDCNSIWEKSFFRHPSFQKFVCVRHS